MCVVQVKEHIEFATPGKIAGFFHETIQGVGGSVPLADGYLPAVYKVCITRLPPYMGCPRPGYRV